MAKKEPGYVYILTNPSFREDWIKIGKSSRPVDVRIKELDNTSVPLPFEIFATMKTAKYNEAEKLVHRYIERFTNLRIRNNREFFNVKPEEARASLERLTNWAKEHPKPKGGSLGEWVFQERKAGSDTPLRTIEPILPKSTEDYVQETREREPLKTQSLTPNAIQLDWKHPVEFPCCPQRVSDKPLDTYMSYLAEGKVFSRNNFGESTILKFGMTDSDNLWVMCSISIGWKSHAITKITYKDGIFYHENMGVYDIGDDPEDIFDSILNREGI